MAIASASTASAVSPAIRIHAGWPVARRLGIGGLRFGGQALTQRMLEGARAGVGSRIVDLGPGDGSTGRGLNTVNIRSYTAVCRDETQRTMVTKGLEGINRDVIIGSSDRTGLPDGVATSVIGECVLTGLSDPGKVAVLVETGRLLRPGGYAAFHELMALRTAWSGPEVPLRAELGAVHGAGLRLLDEPGWRRIVEDAGLEFSGLIQRAVEIPSTPQLMRGLGPRRALRALGRGGRGYRAAGYMLERHRDELVGVVIAVRRPTFAG